MLTIETTMMLANLATESEETEETAGVWSISDDESDGVNAEDELCTVL